MARGLKTRKQITVTLKTPGEIQRWEQTAARLGYEEPSKCIRALAEEGRLRRLEQLDRQTQTAPDVAHA